MGDKWSAFLAFFVSLQYFMQLTFSRKFALMLYANLCAEQEGKDGGKLPPAAVRKREERLARLKDSGNPCLHS